MSVNYIASVFVAVFYSSLRKAFLEDTAQIIFFFLTSVSAKLHIGHGSQCKEVEEFCS